MITVKIPAAIRVCSPVVCVSEPSVGSFEIGERHVIKSTEDGEAHVNGWWTPRACWALVISDPTGAAHLAWWLRAQPARSRETFLADSAALGCDAQTLISVIERASVAADCTRRDLELLRDYAHRVAGVTNG